MNPGSSVSGVACTRHRCSCVCRLRLFGPALASQRVAEISVKLRHHAVSLCSTFDRPARPFEISCRFLRNRKVVEQNCRRRVARDTRRQKLSSALRVSAHRCLETCVVKPCRWRNVAAPRCTRRLERACCPVEIAALQRKRCETQMRERFWTL
jgi:hypothetical protein